MRIHIQPEREILQYYVVTMLYIKHIMNKRIVLYWNVPEKTVQHVHQYKIIHKSNFVLCQNPEGQELWVTLDELNGPEQLWFLFLKLPQHLHGKAHMVHSELGLVLAHHIKHMVFRRANPQLLQNLVSVHCSSMKEPSNAGTYPA